ncbi:MAG: glycosyltransferase family 4 protein [Planctomycetota bacterium]
MLDLLRSLDPRLFQVTLVAGEETGQEGSLWHEVERLNIPHYKVPALVRDISPLRDYRAMQALRRAISRVRPTIVHCHTSKAGLLGCHAAQRERVPGVVLSPHGHILGQEAEIPGVPKQGLRRRMIVAAARYSARHADVVIAPNAVERHEGIQHKMWTDGQSVTVPNGVDTNRFVPRERDHARVTLGWPLQQRIIGVVARLTREKGIDIAVEAIARLPEDVHLIIAGDGPERGNLEQQVQQLGASERVTFLGVTDRVEELLPAFDALLVPSRTEAHGMVAAEALACRVPIVSADVGGLRSLIQHEHTGLMVPTGNVTALAGALRRLLENPGFAERLASRGRAFISGNYSLANMIDRTEAVYQQLASSH